MKQEKIKKIIARRLQDVRKMRGLTQAALAEKIGSITKSSIEKIEKAEMVPAPQTMSKLADALEVTTDDLIRPYVINIDYDKIRYRKRSKMSKKDIERIQRLYGSKLEKYIELEQLLKIEVTFTFNYDDMPVRSYQDAQHVAQRFRKDMGWENLPVISPIQQLEEKGIKVFVLDEQEITNKKFDGMCYKDGDLAVVILQKCESSERDRFTLFHEMGHLLMNTGDIEGRELEGLCNAFASEVLLPEEIFRSALGDSSKIFPATLKILQDKWGISCDAQMYKAKELKIISDNRHIAYCVRKNRSKDFKAWMDESSFSPERTRRFETLVYRAMNRYKITTTKAAGILGRSVEELNQVSEPVLP